MVQCGRFPFNSLRGQNLRCRGERGEKSRTTAYPFGPGPHTEA